MLRQKEDPETPVLAPEADLREEQDQDKRVLCSVCMKHVISQGQRREVGGHRMHVCANTHEFLF